MRSQYDTIEVAVRISERCNIAGCTHCHRLDDAAAGAAVRPAFMPDDTVHALGDFLATGVREHRARSVHVMFHGGEPMLMRPERFDGICTRLESEVGPLTDLRLSIRTNATLVDEAWLRTLVKHAVGVGVSLDGPSAVHDLDCLDHHGGGTYHQAISGLSKLQAAARGRLLAEPVAIAVVRPTASGAVVFNHIADALGVRRLHFLLPADSDDTRASIVDEGCARYMTEVYRAWVRRGDFGIRVRFIDQAIGFVGDSPAANREAATKSKLVRLAIGHNGDLEPAEPSGPQMGHDGDRPNVRTHTLSRMLAADEALVSRF